MSKPLIKPVGFGDFLVKRVLQKAWENVGFIDIGEVSSPQGAGTPYKTC